MSVPRVRGQALLVAVFVAYLVLLAWIILWKLQPPYTGGGAVRETNLVPYLPTGGKGGSDPLEVAMNVVLFVPLGAFLGLLAPAWRWWKRLALVAAVSIFFEIAQYILAIGRSDIADVIDNTLGGAIGLGLLALLQRRSGERAGDIMSKALMIGTGVLALVVVLLLSTLRFHHPDV